MRRYAEGEDVADILAALATTVEDHWKRFAGISPAPVIPAKRMEFLDKCLMLQKTEGPVTKGSMITIYGANGRRE